MYQKCCPSTFSFNTQYKITSNDINRDGLKHIRPRQELKAVKKLSGCEFFDEDVSNLLKDAFNMKFRTTVKGAANISQQATPAESDDTSESDISTNNEEPLETIHDSSMSGDSDTDVAHKKETSSDEDSDPFDFYTVTLLSEDGYTDL